MMTEALRDLTPQELIRRVPTDIDGTVRDHAVARIREKGAQVKAAIDRGVPPAEYRLLSKVHEALEASSQVVGRAWALANHRRQKHGG